MRVGLVTSLVLKTNLNMTHSRRLNFSSIICRLSFILTLTGFLAPSFHAQRCTRLNNEGSVDTLNQCEYGFGGPFLFCDVGSETCKYKSAVPLTGASNTFTNPSQQVCENGFRPPSSPNGKKCMIMSAMGCSIITRNHYTRNGNFHCPFHSSFVAAVNDDDPGTCSRNTNIADIRSEGDYCGYRNGGIYQECGHNLICNANGQCAKRSDVGGECGSHNMDCMHGLMCVNHICIRPYSLPDNTPCLTDNGKSKLDEACTSGFCSSSGVCSKTTTLQPCWRNSDCTNAAHSACIGVTGEKPGVCLAVYNVARGDWLRCIYNKCKEEGRAHSEQQQCMTTGWSIDGNYDQKCMKEYARYMCSQYCTKNPDERNPLLTGGDSFVESGEVPFKFNCRTQTVTRLSQSSDCTITSLFSGCDAIVDYPSSSIRAVASLSLSICLGIAFMILML